jgi:ribosomal protein S18 acetylase RimI-like enzyme
MLARRIEEAALNAWPALQQMLYDGWLLRFARGYTKRANSVNPLFASSIAVGDKIAACEALYASRGLRPTFRITPFAAPPDLDQALEQRGYRKIDLTVVMHRDLAGADLQPALSAELRDTPLDEWVSIYWHLSQTQEAHRQTHLEILRAIPSRRLPVVLADAGQAVACGLGVLEQGYFGLFDVITDPARRNRGYGSQLICGLLERALESGAQHAYLQVVAENAPARHIYTRLGFAPLYSYWYRVKPEGG